MALADTKLTVLQVINEVQRKLKVRATSATTGTSHATVLVDLLNDVIEEISDKGDWVQLRSEVDVSAVSGQSIYTIPVSGSTESIHHLHEVRVSGRNPPLDWFGDVSEWRQMTTLQSRSRPVRAVVVAEDSRGNPTFGVWPIPGTNEDGMRMTVHFYLKPRRYVAGTDDAETLALPGRILVQGTYAKALLDESGGAPTPQYTAQYTIYKQMVDQALNRFTADTGTTFSLVPARQC
jgi:hypothetical protein